MRYLPIRVVRIAAAGLLLFTLFTTLALGAENDTAVDEDPDHTRGARREVRFLRRQRTQRPLAQTVGAGCVLELPVLTQKIGQAEQSETASCPGEQLTA